MHIRTRGFVTWGERVEGKQDPVPSRHLIRSLEVFIAVAEELHFGRAAQRLLVPPSVVSDTVRKLEREIGALLLLRTTRSVSLTAAGECYLADARDVLQRLASAAERARHAAAGDRGTIRLGVTLQPASRAAARLVAQAEDALPGLQIQPSSHYSPDQVRLVRAGELDAGIAIEPASQQDMEALVLAELPWDAVMRADHALASRDVVSLDELKGEALAYTGAHAHSAAHDLIASALRAAGVEPKRVVETVDESSQVEAVMSQSCIGIALRPWGHTLPAGVVMRPIAPPGVSPARLCVIWRADSPNRSITHLVDLARSMREEGQFDDLRGGPAGA